MKRRSCSRLAGRPDCLLAIGLLAALAGLGSLRAASGAERNEPGQGGQGPGQLVWRSDKLGWFPRMPALVGSMLCHGKEGDANPDYAAEVLGIDVATGKVAWRCRTDGPVACRPVVAEGVILVSCRGKTLYGIDAASGKVKWQAKAGEVYESPVSSGRTAYMGTLREVVALDIPTGEVKWRTKGCGEGNWELMIVPSGDAVYFAKGGPQAATPLHAVDAGTGAARWRFPEAGATERLYDLEVAGATVYVAGPSLRAVDAKTGRLKWSFSPGGTSDSVDCLIVAGGAVYGAATSAGGYDPKKQYNVPARTNEVFCLDAATGRVKWRTPMKANGGMLKFAFAADAVYFGGRGRCCRLNAKTGAVEWDTPECMRLFQVAGGLVYVQVEAGLRALDALTGAVEWLRPAERMTYTDSLIAAGDILIYGDGAVAGRLYAVKGGKLPAREEF